tara:strand:+ start:661 stop:1074 length:414 start_codon:yes stop_codon:yes gene_type:complete
MTQKPQARMLKLKTGEQLIALMYVQDNSDFIRLENPYKIDLHPFDFLGEYVIEEKMTMKPWLFRTKDKVFSVHKNHIITLAVPDDGLAEYYTNLISGRVKPPSMESRQETLNKLLEKVENKEYDDILDYSEGKKTVH